MIDNWLLLTLLGLRTVRECQRVHSFVCDPQERTQCYAF